MICEFVCRCAMVTEQEIKEAITQEGAKTVAQIEQFTHATGGCGRCKIMVEDILQKTVATGQ